MLFLLIGAALAQGIEVVQPGETYIAEEKVFVLPEPYYDRCLANSKALEEARALLEEASSEGVEELDAAKATIIKLQSELIACDDQASRLQLDNNTLFTENKQLRVQRVILGSTAAAAVIIAGLEAWALATR